MSNVTSEIANMQTQTAANNQKTRSPKTDMTDSNMFLSLMLEQLKHQDPTQPTDNTEWLAQLAQYSSLEQMTQMNSNMAALYTDIATNSEITQTLSLVGKEVTIKDPSDENGEAKIIGEVEEASFEDGTGKVKVNDKYYSIASIISVREKSDAAAQPVAITAAPQQ